MASAEILLDTGGVLQAASYDFMVRQIRNAEERETSFVADQDGGVTINIAHIVCVIEKGDGGPMDEPPRASDGFEREIAQRLHGA